MTGKESGKIMFQSFSHVDRFGKSVCWFGLIGAVLSKAAVVKLQQFNGKNMANGLVSH